MGEEDAAFERGDIQVYKPKRFFKKNFSGKRTVLGTCPGGHSPIVASFYSKDALWAHCECGMRWWFRYPFKKPKKKPKKSKTTEMWGDEIRPEDMKRDVAWTHGGKPRCPNHGEPFEVTYLELKEGKGRGQCPVSKAFFFFEVDPEMEQVDKFGNRTKAFRITGNEN